MQKALIIKAFEFVFFSPTSRAAPAFGQFLKGDAGRNLPLLVTPLGIIEIGAGGHGLALISFLFLFYFILRLFNQQQSEIMLGILVGLDHLNLEPVFADGGKHIDPAGL